MAGTDCNLTPTMCHLESTLGGLINIRTTLRRLAPALSGFRSGPPPSKPTRESVKKPTVMNYSIRPPLPSSLPQHNSAVLGT